MTGIPRRSLLLTTAAAAGLAACEPLAPPYSPPPHNEAGVLHTGQGTEPEAAVPDANAAYRRKLKTLSAILANVPFGGKVVSFQPKGKYNTVIKIDGGKSWTAGFDPPSDENPPTYWANIVHVDPKNGDLVTTDLRIYNTGEGWEPSGDSKALYDFVKPGVRNKITGAVDRLLHALYDLPKNPAAAPTKPAAPAQKIVPQAPEPELPGTEIAAVPRRRLLALVVR